LLIINLYKYTWQNWLSCKVTKCHSRWMLMELPLNFESNCCLFLLHHVWYWNKGAFTLGVRASPLVHSLWLRTVKFIAKKSKCAGLAQEIGFSASNSCSLPRLVKVTTQLCTSKKECNKLNLTAAQYFWLVDYNDWSRWFAISSPHVYAVPVTIIWVGLQKKKS